MTNRGTNSLATRGLEEPFFQLCHCVSFLFWREMLELSRMGTYLEYPYLEFHKYRAQVLLLACHCVSFLFWREMLELSRMGTYLEYPYLEFHKYRAQVLLLALRYIGILHILVTYR
jgi:hypothetical protein